MCDFVAHAHGAKAGGAPKVPQPVHCPSSPLKKPLVCAIHRHPFNVSSSYPRQRAGVACDERERAPRWIDMDAPSLQGSLSLAAVRKRLQTYIRPSDAPSASALMECAGWFLYNSASSKLVIHARFDQPRSYLSCHQRSSAKATAIVPFAVEPACVMTAPRS
jgi:hypothetical protein